MRIVFVVLISLLAADLVLGAETIARLKEMHLHTPLEGAVIAVPEGDALQRLAAQIQAGVKAAGGPDLPIRPAAQVRAAGEMEKRTVVAIGSALTNPVVELLYDKGFLYEDAVYPGKGGYAVRTVHNPLGAGFNVVTACGSDPEGVQAAVARLREQIAKAGGKVLPRILDIQLGAPQARTAPPSKEAIEAQVAAYLRLRESGDSPEWALNNFASYGLRYNITGDLGWAEMYRAYLLALVGFWEKKGPWPMEWLWDPYWAWQNCEAAPCFTDAERLKITNFLLDVGRTDRARYAGGLTSKVELSGGHQLDQCLCVFCLGDYFWKYYRHPEAREWLDVVAWRFQTSARYHRLSHDSNDYNHAGYWFLVRHARISGDRTYITNGQFGRFVTLAQMMLDNLGTRAQNGDAGSPFAGPETDMHSMAAWFYKDGRHKWAIRGRTPATPGNYTNDIPPKKPEELLGLFRFNIESEYYRYLTGHEAGGTLPPEVTPIASAYDKISLRADFSPRAEYLLLDGVSRGEHGHDDGNSIIRYTDKGRIWLVDDDYIRRAPRWHNSAVVIRDGAAALQPPLARADHTADLGPVALLRSTLPRYTGTDWERNIVWVKGKCFVFLDNFVASEPADYRLQVVWRTLGETSLRDGDFEARQAGQSDSLALCKPDKDSDGNGVPDGFEASFTNPAGEVRARAALDTTHYRSAPASVRLESDPRGYVVLWAWWPVKGGEKYRFHTLCKTDALPGCAASTTIYWTGAGRQRLTKASQAGPIEGRRDWAPLDIVDTAPADAETAQVCIRISARESQTASGKAWFDDLSLTHLAADGKETVIFPPLAREPTYATFHVKNAEGARLRVSSFLQRGHPCKDGYFVGYAFAGPEVKTLQQIADRRLERGQSHAFANLLYTSDEGTPQKLEIRSISPHCALVTGGETPMVAGIRPAGRTEYDVGPLTLDADLFCIQGNTLYAAGLRRAVLRGKEVFRSAQPVNQAVPLPAGVVAGIAGALPAPPPRTVAPTFRPEGLGERAQATVKGAVRSLYRADVSGDGRPETIVGDATGAVTVLSDDGRTLWQAQTGRAVNVVRAADVNGDGKVEVAAGGDDCKVHLYDAAGRELWAHPLENFHGRDGKVVALEIGDLAGDGNRRIVAGTEAWHWYALDGNGKQIWRAPTVHAATVGALADLDGDKRLEVVTGDEYYHWSVFSHEGKPLWGLGGGPGVLALCVADLDGDGKQECLFGTGDGAASLRCTDFQGKERWSRSLGDEPRAILCADLDGDGKREVVASSESMYLYAFKADGTPLWRRDMGEVVGSVAVLGNRVAAGSQDGTVHVLDAAGKTVGRFACGAPVQSLIAGGEEVIAGLADGRVAWVR